MVVGGWVMCQCFPLCLSFLAAPPTPSHPHQLTFANDPHNHTQFAPPVDARALLATDPVKNPNAILRYALPINNKPIREIQVSLAIQV